MTNGSAVVPKQESDEAGLHLVSVKEEATAAEEIQAHESTPVKDIHRCCSMCNSSRGCLSPLDRPGQDRAWGSSERCRWCEIVDDIVNVRDNTEMCPAGQQALLHAYFSMRLEGQEDITEEALRGRCRILKMVLGHTISTPPSDVTPTVSGSGGSASDSGFTPAKHARHGGSVPACTPPPKRTRTASTASAGTPSAGNLADVGPSPSRNDGARAASIPPGSSRLPNGAGLDIGHRADDGLDGQAQHGDDGQEGFEITEHSLDAKFPSGILGNSLARMRSTINGYCDRLGSTNWLETYKPPTIKALERRLNHQSDNVKKSMHVELMVGFSQLERRIDHLNMFYKHLAHWVSNQNDNHLMDALRVFAPLKMYLEAVGFDIAPDLQLVLARAEFVKVFTATSSTATAFKVFTGIDLATLYKTMQEQTAAAPALEAPGVEESPADESPATPVKEESAPQQAKQKYSRQLAPCKLNFPPSLVSWVTGIVDKAIQFTLFSLPPEEDTLKDGMARVVVDLRSLSSAWVQKMGTDTSAKTFNDVILSVATVLSCHIRDERECPLPSEVRSARQVIHNAASPTDGFKIAQCMLHYATMKQAMETSRQIATAGLQDVAANDRFKLVLEELERELDLAFDGYSLYLDKGNQGHQHNITSYQEVLVKVSDWATELMSLSSLWSPSGMESQVTSLCSCLQYMVGVLDFGSVILLRQVLVYLPTLVSIGNKGAVAPAAVVCVKEELPMAGGDGAAGGAEELGQAEVCGTTGGRNTVGGAEGGDLALHEQVTKAKGAEVQALAMAVKQHKDALTRYAGVVSERVSTVDQVIKHLIGKGGEAMKQKYQDTDLADTKKITARMAQRLTALLQYFEDTAALFETPLVAPGSSWEDGGHMSYLTVLTRFVAFHRALGDLAFGTAWKGDFVEVIDGLGLDAAVQAFKSEIAEPMYIVHVMSTLMSALAQLDTWTVGVSIIQPKALEDSDLATIFSLLVQDPAAETLAARPAVFGDAEQAQEWLQGLPHNSLLREFSAFMENTGLTTARFAGIRKAGDRTCVDIPWHVVLLCLETSGLVRDVAILAASLHVQHMLSAADDGTEPLTAQSLDDIARVLQVFADAMVRLDLHLHTQDMSAMEADGWQFPVSCTSLKSWQEGMAIMRGRAVRLWLQKWVRLLTHKTTKIKSDTPSWQVAFPGGALNTNLASALAKGRLGKVVAGHNMLHDLMSHMSAGATSIAVSPVLSEHPLTENAIAEALHVMDGLKTASIVINGLDIIVTYKLHHMGPVKASKFLAEHPPEKRPSEIPAALWTELEFLKADMSTKPPRAKCSTPPGEGASGGSTTKDALECEPEAAAPAETGTVANVSAPANAAACEPRFKRRRQ